MHFLNNSTHNLISGGKTVKSDRWTGLNGLFMQSLREAYNNVVSLQEKPNMNIEEIDFQEEQTSGYRERTIKNASADATIAIASDFNSAGERLTKTSVLNQMKLYLPISTDIFSSANDVTMMAGRIVSEIVKLKKSNISLNVAGNGIYTLKNTFPGGQKSVDNFTFELLENVIKRLKENNITVDLIRTGGQTGFDEAGAKAGIRLGIPTMILAPKGWVFRDISGRDIANEQLFKSRFTAINKTKPPQQPTSDLQLKDGNLYSPSDINSKMLEKMGYSPIEIGKILKQIC